MLMSIRAKSIRGRCRRKAPALGRNRVQGLKEMQQAVHGRLSTCERLVKSPKFFSSYLTQEDLSRLGRNYIEVGKLTEEFFPLHDVRLVAVSDGVDSDEGEDDFTPFKNIMNEMFSLRMEALVIQYSPRIL